MRTSRWLILIFALIIIAGVFYLVFVHNASAPSSSTVATTTSSLENAFAICNSIPNGSIQDETTTNRVFINLPKTYYDAQNLTGDFTTISGNATALYISNGGLPGSALQATANCWSTYEEFDGTSEVDLTVPGTASSTPAYVVRFIVHANPPDTTPASASSTITLSSITPSSGAVGTTVTITGSGFIADNTVLFDGNVAAANVHLTSFTNGHQTIKFTVPEALAPDCATGQACPQYRVAVTPRVYQVSVENKNGTSTTLPFTVINNE